MFLCIKIDAESGHVTTKRSLDVNAVKWHSLHIRAQDRGDKPKNSTGISY